MNFLIIALSQKGYRRVKYRHACAKDHALPGKQTTIGLIDASEKVRKLACSLNFVCRLNDIG
jgi:hypothetical protein